MERGCGVVLVSNGGKRDYNWLCDDYGPISFYPDVSSGHYRFTVLTGFPTDAWSLPSGEALPKKVHDYDLSEEEALKVAHSVLIRSDDCVYFPG